MGTFLEMNDSAARILNSTNVALTSAVTLGTGTPTEAVRKASAAINTSNNTTLDAVKAANLVAAMQKSKDNGIS